MPLKMTNKLLAAVCLSTLWGCTDSSDRTIDSPPSYATMTDLDSFCDRLPRSAYASYQKHEASNGWFEVYEIEPGIWAIYEPFQWQEVISYLIVGEESAVLFDTGNGIGDIRSVVDQLTDRTIRVLNSHSHFDHIGGNFQFDEVLSVSTPFSLARTKGRQDDEIRMEVSSEALCRGLPEGVDEEAHRTRPYSISGPIKEGDILDLGGRRLEVLHVPGHTDDAIALLDRDAGFLWSGDSFYEGPIWLFAPETDLASYQESVARMAALAPDLQAVFPAHNTPRADPALLVELRGKLDQVLAGEIDPTTSSDDSVEFRFDNFGLLMRKDYYRIHND